MKIYKTPLYPALMARLPGEGRRNVKAAGGYFNVADEDVADFEAFVAQRPHYQISAVASDPAPSDEPGDAVDPVGSEHGVVVQPEPITESERHPEQVTVESLDSLTVPVLRERLQGLGLDDQGRKAVLVKRLADATNTATGLGDDVTDDADAEDTNG